MIGSHVFEVVEVTVQVNNNIVKEVYSQMN